MMINKIFLCPMILFCYLLTACGGGSGDSTTANVAPTVTIQPDTTAVAGEQVTLFSAAQDSDGQVTEYLWAQTAGTEVEIVNANSPFMSFVSPDIDSSEVLTFSLTVTDNSGAKISAQVNVSLTAVLTISGAFREPSVDAKGVLVTLNHIDTKTGNIGPALVQTIVPSDGRFALKPENLTAQDLIDGDFVLVGFGSGIVRSVTGTGNQNINIATDALHTYLAELYAQDSGLQASDLTNEELATLVANVDSTCGNKDEDAIECILSDSLFIENLIAAFDATLPTITIPTINTDPSNAGDTDPDASSINLVTNVAYSAAEDITGFALGLSTSTGAVLGGSNAYSLDGCIACNELVVNIEDTGFAFFTSDSYTAGDVNNDAVTDSITLNSTFGPDVFVTRNVYVPSEFDCDAGGGIDIKACSVVRFTECVYNSGDTELDILLRVIGSTVSLEDNIVLSNVEDLGGLISRVTKSSSGDHAVVGRLVSSPRGQVRVTNAQHETPFGYAYEFEIPMLVPSDELMCYTHYLAFGNRSGQIPGTFGDGDMVGLLAQLESSPPIDLREGLPQVALDVSTSGLLPPETVISAPPMVFPPMVTVAITNISTAVTIEAVSDKYGAITNVPVRCEVGQEISMSAQYNGVDYSASDLCPVPTPTPTE